MASLKKRHGIFYIQYYVGARQKRVSLHTDSLAIAKEKVRQYESAMLHGEDSPLPTRTPIAQVVGAYVAHIRRQQGSGAVNIGGNQHRTTRTDEGITTAGREGAGANGDKGFNGNGSDDGTGQRRNEQFRRRRGRDDDRRRTGPDNGREPFLRRLGGTRGNADEKGQKNRPKHGVHRTPPSIPVTTPILPDGAASKRFAIIL